MGHSLFWMAINRCTFEIFNCRCRDLNRESLVSKATALPTAPQPLLNRYCQLQWHQLLNVIAVQIFKRCQLQRFKILFQNEVFKILVQSFILIADNYTFFMNLTQQKMNVFTDQTCILKFNEDKFYNVSPFPQDVEVRRSDVAMNPFIFLLKNNGQSILFISILGVN